MPGVVVLLLPVDYAAPYGRRSYGFALPAFSSHERRSFSRIKSIPYSGNGDKAFIGCSDGRSTCIRLDAIRTERAVLKSKRNGAGREWDETDDGVVERGFRNAR